MIIYNIYDLNPKIKKYNIVLNRVHIRLKNKKYHKYGEINTTYLFLVSNF